ncbi:Conserved_hypothetical protein [Hexamita inflata]|uniref:Uncharacterized protein n=1 Tax=Hexamita inflata TaxID=28002 RepID=A0AA86QHW5_9EUKA|nr:Conserved hypothetical protein [Hexamita inflata]
MEITCASRDSNVEVIQYKSDEIGKLQVDLDLSKQEIEYVSHLLADKSNSDIDYLHRLTMSKQFVNKLKQISEDIQSVESYFIQCKAEKSYTKSYMAKQFIKYSQLLQDKIQTLHQFRQLIGYPTTEFLYPLPSIQQILESKFLDFEFICQILKDFVVFDKSQNAVALIQLQVPRKYLTSFILFKNESAISIQFWNKMNVYQKYESKFSFEQLQEFTQREAEQIAEYNKLDKICKLYGQQICKIPPFNNNYSQFLFVSTQQNKIQHTRKAHRNYAENLIKSSKPANQAAFIRQCKVNSSYVQLEDTQITISSQNTPKLLVHNHVELKPELVTVPNQEQLISSLTQMSQILDLSKINYSNGASSKQFEPEFKSKLESAFNCQIQDVQEFLMQVKAQIQSDAEFNQQLEKTRRKTEILFGLRLQNSEELLQLIQQLHRQYKFPFKVIQQFDRPVLQQLQCKSLSIFQNQLEQLFQIQIQNPIQFTDQFFYYTYQYQEETKQFVKFSAELFQIKLKNVDDLFLFIKNKKVKSYNHKNYFQFQTVFGDEIKQRLEHTFKIKVKDPVEFVGMLK